MKKFLDRLFYRARQFFLAVTSRVNTEDRDFAQKYLTIPETALFNQLPRDEQKHSIIVARKMLKIAHGPQADVDERVIAKVGLLHDIGKAAVKLGVMDRSFLVIMRRVFKVLYDKIAESGESPASGTFARKFYVHREHAGIGAALLKNAGTEGTIIQIIEHHDDKPKESDPIELFLLRKVDNAN